MLGSRTTGPQSCAQCQFNFSTTTSFTEPPDDPTATAKSPTAISVFPLVCHSDLTYIPRRLHWVIQAAMMFTNPEIWRKERKQGRKGENLPPLPVSKGKMRILKIVGLGTLFFFIISIAVGLFGLMLGERPSNAGVALSALTAGTIYNPYFWLAVLVAYGAAFWIVMKRRNA
jgi:hypothetical protein